MRERRPKRDARGWVEVGPVGAGGPHRIAGSLWRRGRVSAISALELAELPDRSGVCPQWHVSVSRCGKRPKPIDVARTLRAFGMVGTEEHNHHLGGVRHFWLPVDPAHRVGCECRTDEEVIIDPRQLPLEPQTRGWRLPRMRTRGYAEAVMPDPRAGRGPVSPCELLAASYGALVGFEEAGGIAEIARALVPLAVSPGGLGILLRPPASGNAPWAQLALGSG